MLPGHLLVRTVIVLRPTRVIPAQAWAWSQANDEYTTFDPYVESS